MSACARSSCAGNYAQNTITNLRVVEEFRQFIGKRLDDATDDDIRRYHAHLLGDRKRAPHTVVQRVAAVRFLYCKTLKRRDMREDLPYPRNYDRKLPVVLSPEEVARLIDCARNLYHRALIMTVYSCGLRRIEACRLKVSDIESQRMMIRITQGRGGVDRDVPLSPALLETLRQYWRWMRPNTYLFPGTEEGWRVDRPITAKMVWAAVDYGKNWQENVRVMPATSRFGSRNKMKDGCDAPWEARMVPKSESAETMTRSSARARSTMA